MDSQRLIKYSDLFIGYLQDVGGELLCLVEALAATDFVLGFAGSSS